MRLLRSLPAAAVLVALLAGTCWADGADLVARCTRLREKDPVEATMVLRTFSKITGLIDRS